MDGAHPLGCWWAWEVAEFGVHLGDDNGEIEADGQNHGEGDGTGGSESEGEGGGDGGCDDTLVGEGEGEGSSHSDTPQSGHRWSHRICDRTGSAGACRRWCDRSAGSGSRTR